MTVLGADRLIKQLTDLPRKMQGRIQDALNVSAAEMLNLATVKIQKSSGSGRTYKRGKRTHIASSPGEYPNADYGELVRSFGSGKTGALEAGWWARAKHARPLELGTSRMAARPFMKPTFLALRSGASARVLSEINLVLREVRG